MPVYTVESCIVDGTIGRIRVFGGDRELKDVIYADTDTGLVKVYAGELYKKGMLEMPIVAGVVEGLHVRIEDTTTEPKGSKGAE